MATIDFRVEGDQAVFGIFEGELLGLSSPQPTMAVEAVIPPAVERLTREWDTLAAERDELCASKLPFVDDDERQGVLDEIYANDDRRTLVGSQIGKLRRIQALILDSMFDEPSPSRRDTNW